MNTFINSEFSSGSPLEPPYERPNEVQSNQHQNELTERDVDAIGQRLKMLPPRQKMNVETAIKRLALVISKLRGLVGEGQGNNQTKLTPRVSSAPRQSGGQGSLMAAATATPPWCSRGRSVARQSARLHPARIATASRPGRRHSLADKTGGHAHHAHHVSFLASAASAASACAIARFRFRIALM